MLQKKAMHISADKKEPAGAAQPMGYRESGNSRAVRYAPGILTRRIAAKLWIKERIAFPYAQK